MARAGRNKFGGTELYFVAHMTLQLLIILNAEWLFKVPLWNTTRGHKWIFAAATGPFGLKHNTVLQLER